ncbi:MAG TPA: glycerol dehydrogenase [Candidatus Paceibacterota bacterium]|nr:glycerol dehydrogenase [Verrucomicrobiota bacterium]HRY47159.1 glycerol dehydrogenase [Candidatus Paceibacterota bacterium]HSA00116.1 glycerol dehydrogenase [Candidatus Paceibacterota bacterium]
MFKKAVFPGKYLQGAGAIAELPALIKSLGNQGLILASPSVKEKVIPSCGIDLKAQSIPIDVFQGECCQKELDRVSALIAHNQVDVLIGMGGGKTIDTAKIAADRARIPVIIIPTIASTDAPCSGCAVLYSEGGIFESVCYQTSNPAVVLVDVAILAMAPARFLVAGMGDALSTWFEARSCERTQSPNECGGISTTVGLHIAKLCYETLLAYGPAAKVASQRHLITPAFEHIVEANILLSGIGFESAGLASAHSIHNGLTALPETHAFYHGEKVAFGVLAGLQLTDAPAAELETVFAFCEEVGLPTTLSDIGLGNAGRDKLMLAAAKTCEPGQPIHHEAGTITREKVLDAMLAADALGQARKSGSRC